MTDLSSKLLAALDLVVLEPADDGAFILHGDCPTWFGAVVPGALSGEVIRPDRAMPFLANFLVDAEEVWGGSKRRRARSGPWVERIGSGEIQLEAHAMRVGARSVLLVERLGEAFEEQESVLQLARESILNREELESRVRERTATIRFREEEIALRLVAAAESRDSDTGAHIRRIGLYSSALAQELGSDAQFVEDIRVAALMHDVGKIGVPDRILQKPGPLTSGEREVMQQHTVIGAGILEGSDVSVLQLAHEIALSHHEWWDGSGYPRGLREDSIPVSARIVAVADVYDALVTDRVYRPALPVADVVRMMTDARGRQFEPAVLDTFLRLQPRFVRIHRRISAPRGRPYRSDPDSEGVADS